MRGNVLNLTCIWADAVSTNSESRPVPSHLQLWWREGLPYWIGLNAEDFAALTVLNTKVADLLTRQQSRLAWLPFAPATVNLYPEWLSSSELDENPVAEPLYPAYTLVGIPGGLRPRFPRYDHAHSMGEMANHPPIKERWPKPGRLGLRDFLVEAIQAEGVAVWQFAATALQLSPAESFISAIAVASAPWFAPDYKHIATAIAKTDYYLFA